MTPFGKKTLETPESINEIERLVSMECGKDMKIKYIDKKQEPNNNKASNIDTIENLANDFSLPIEVEDN